MTTQLELNYFAHNYEMLYTVNEERRVFNDSYRQTKPELYLLRDGLRKSYEQSEEQQRQFKQILEQLKPDIRRVFNDSYRQTKPELYLLRDGLRKSYEQSEEQQRQFKQILEQLKPDIIVVPAIAAPWIHDLFNEVALKIDENSSYSVYQLIK